MSSSATLSGNSYQSIASLPPPARRVLTLLEKIDGGVLSLRTPEGQVLAFGSGQRHASMELNNWRVFSEVIRSGDIGFAESYILGDWQTDDLPALLGLLVANRNRLEQMVYGSSIGRIAHRIRHLFNRNTRRGARRNIHAHYDLGNPFYALWLDQSMTYSSALFDKPGQATLAQAQERKIERALDSLELQAGQRLLEIGCGWGSLAEAAMRRKLRVRGLTLSDEQLQYARRRLADAPGCEFLLQDYRDESGRYDAIASIEMFEAVGEPYWPDYFRAIKRCLAPQGRALVQTITIADHLFERYRRGTDFIQQYVFPGGMLPSAAAFRREAGRAGLAVRDEFRFGTDYARTLALWREQFSARAEQIRAQGFDEPFMRTWLFYFAYCEAAFVEHNTDVIQFTLTHD